MAWTTLGPCGLLRFKKRHNTHLHSMDGRSFSPSPPALWKPAAPRRLRASNFYRRNNAVGAVPLLREIQPHFAEALGVIAPVFTNLHEQEKMDRLLENFR